MATKHHAPLQRPPDGPSGGAAHLADAELLAIMEDGAQVPDLTAGAAHLAICAACADRALALQAGERRLRGGDEGWASEAGHARARARLQERLSAVDSGTLWNAWTWAAQATRPALAAAAAAVLILAVVGVSRFDWRGPSDAVSATMVMRGERASYRDALPDRSLTPGATVALAADELCRLGPQEPSQIPEPVRVSILRAYGMENLADHEYELDYLITPDLGGSPDPRNLWPEPYASPVWNAKVKDELEDLLPQLVCQGRIDLATAQREIAADWVAAYKKYFKTDRPLRRS